MTNDQRRFLRRIFVRHLAFGIGNFFAIWIQGFATSGFAAAALSIWSAMLSDKITGDGINHLQMAGGIHDERAEIMIDGAGVGFIFHAASPGEFGDFVRRPGQKAPVIRIVMVTFSVGLAASPACRWPGRR